MEMEILEVEPLKVIRLLRVVKHLIKFHNEKEILNKFKGHKESETPQEGL